MIYLFTLKYIKRTAVDILSSAVFLYLCVKLTTIYMAGESKAGIEMRKMLNSMSIETIMAKHMNESSKYKPIGFNSWKDFWESKVKNNLFPSSVEKCACCKKDTQPNEFVGAHIIQVDTDKMYIYPLCQTCNSTYGEDKEESPIFEVKKSLCADFSLSEARIVHHEE